MKFGSIYNPDRKKFKKQKLSSKVLAFVFSDRDVILFVDYLDKGATITAQHYVAILDKLNQQLLYKSRGKL
jgi:hypothetical protein